MTDVYICGPSNGVLTQLVYLPAVLTANYCRGVFLGI